MVTTRPPVGRLVLVLAGALLAAAAMLWLTPVENSIAAFGLWTFFFAALLTPARVCRISLRHF